MFLLIVGGITLFFYLLGRFRTQQLTFTNRLNKEQIPHTENTKLQQQIFIGSGLLLYFLSITYPDIFYYSFLYRLFDFIHSIYKTPLIGWVIGLIGFFFMLNTVLKSINAFSSFFERRNKGEEALNDESDKFDDYTEV